MIDVLIVGAGLSGLTAAKELLRAGKSVRVIEKSRSGGRLATRRIGGATLDHGAQFFTVRSSEFSTAVEQWVDAGAASVWTHGFDLPADGYPRYRGEGGMSRLAKFIAAEVATLGADIILSRRVSAVIPGANELTVTYDAGDGEPDDASAVIITSPIPQTIEILQRGGIVHPPELDLVVYNKVLAILMTLETTPQVGSSGGRQTPLDPIFTFVAENRAKGISAEPSVTCHVEPALSEALYDLTDEDILGRLSNEINAITGTSKILEVQVKRWRYAGPINPHKERAVVALEEPGKVVLCGDGFGGPKVEGAFLSGLAAAATILES